MRRETALHLSLVSRRSLETLRLPSESQLQGNYPMLNMPGNCISTRMMLKSAAVSKETNQVKRSWRENTVDSMPVLNFIRINGMRQRNFAIRKSLQQSSKIAQRFLTKYCSMSKIFRCYFFTVVFRIVKLSIREGRKNHM